MGHKSTLYDEQLKVPLIISYPPRFATGRRIAERTSLLDIHPTLLALLGESAPGAVQGLDLGPLMVPAPDAGEGAAGLRRALSSRPLFGELGPLGFRWELTYYRKSILSDRHKLILNYVSGGEVSRELFDIANDPGEQNDLYHRAGAEPEIRRLEERLSGFIRSGASHNAGFRQRNRIQIDNSIQETLRSLGYID